MRACVLCFALGSGVLAVSATMSACAATDSTTPPATDTPPPTSEGGLPGFDAAAPIDAPIDAVADADAAPRECSDDGFCYTAVPPDQTLRGVWGDGLGIAWAVTTQGAVLRWDGSAWKVHASKLGPLYAIWGSGPTDVWIGGEKGLYHGVGSTSATLAFVANAAPGQPIPITSLWGTGANEVWAVGGRAVDRSTYPPAPAKARVLHYTGATDDAGAAWALDPVSSEAVGYAQVWGSAASGVWIAGSHPMPSATYFDETVVYRKPAAATTFAEVALPVDPAAYSFYAGLAKLTGGTASGDTIWILGRTNSNFPGYWRGTSADGGATFTFTLEMGTHNDEPALNAVWGTAPNDTWAVGDYGRVRHGTGTNGAWPQAALTRTQVPVITPFYAVWSSGPKDVWVVGDGIALHLDPTKKTAGTP